MSQVLSPEQVAGFSALLWGVGFLILTAVDLALVLAHRSPMLLAIGGLFVLPTICAASTGTSQTLSVLGRLAQATPQTFSAGVATAMAGCTVEDVLREADDACYRATQRGGGRVPVSRATAA